MSKKEEHEYKFTYTEEDEFEINDKSLKSTLGVSGRLIVKTSRETISELVD